MRAFVEVCTSLPRDEGPPSSLSHRREAYHRLNAAKLEQASTPYLPQKLVGLLICTRNSVDSNLEGLEQRLASKAEIFRSERQVPRC